jgi:hypothetical protein
MAYLNPVLSSICAGSRPALFIPAAIRERLAGARSIGLDSIQQQNKQRVRQSGFRWLTVCLTVSVLTVLTGSSTAAPSGSPLEYTTLNYGGSGTFLTGIRGNNIVGNCVIAGTGETGGLLYNMSTATWAPFPETTANGRQLSRSHRILAIWSRVRFSIWSSQNRGQLRNTNLIPV